MIAAHPENKPLPGYNLTGLVHDRFLNDRTDRNDNGLRRINNSKELFNTVSAQVGNRNRATLVFFRFKLFGPRPCRQILDLCADLAQAFVLSRPDNGRNEPLLYRNRASELYVRVLDD